METMEQPTRERVEATALWEDFIDIFFAPRQVFARRSSGRFGLALLTLMILTAVVALGTQMALSEAIAGDMRRAVEASTGGAVPEEGLAQMRSFGTVIAIVGSLVGVPLGVFLSGLVIWILATLLEATTTFAAAVMIATYASFPRLIQGVVGMLQGLVLNPDSIYDVSIGLSRFVPREGTNPVLLALADRVDLFSIWIAVLVAIGVHVVAGTSKSRAYLLAAAFWLLGMLPALIPVLMRQLAGS
jgi:hypothetical protein